MLNMFRIAAINIGIYAVIGIVIASIFRLTECYHGLKMRSALFQPIFFDIFWEIMIWPFLLLILIFLFSKSLVDLLCEIGNCVLRVSKDFKKRRKTFLKTSTQS